MANFMAWVDHPGWFIVIGLVLIAVLLMAGQLLHVIFSKRAPTVFRAVDVRGWANDMEVLKDGRFVWHPARDEHPGGIRFLAHRTRLAWGVFTGENDVLDWEDRA